MSFKPACPGIEPVITAGEHRVAEIFFPKPRRRLTLTVRNVISVECPEAFVFSN